VDAPCTTTFDASIVAGSILSLNQNTSCRVPSAVAPPLGQLASTRGPAVSNAAPLVSFSR
jgi:hypothetical protein